jgi:hypothetical protein
MTNLFKVLHKYNVDRLVNHYFDVFFYYGGIFTRV